LNPEAHSLYSQLRERIVEHVFVGDMLRKLWCREIYDVEVLRSEFDAHGYDLVFSRGKVVRHLQLKTGTSARPRNVSVPEVLAAKPSGCVLWIKVSAGLELGPYFWFGKKPGKRLGDLSNYDHPLRATHNKDSKRPTRFNHRLVPGAAFRELQTPDEVLIELFGPLVPTKALPASLQP
jgi:hypothetical protein